MPSMRARWSKLCVRVMSHGVLCLALCFSFTVQLLAQGTGGRIGPPGGRPHSGAVPAVHREGLGHARRSEPHRQQRGH